MHLTLLICNCGFLRERSPHNAEKKRYEIYFGAWKPELGSVFGGFIGSGVRDVAEAQVCASVFPLS